VWQHTVFDIGCCSSFGCGTMDLILMVAVEFKVNFSVYSPVKM
jgi:hypothetical protein